MAAVNLQEMTQSSSMEKRIKGVYVINPIGPGYRPKLFFKPKSPLLQHVCYNVIIPLEMCKINIIPNYKAWTLQNEFHVRVGIYIGYQDLHDICRYVSDTEIMSGIKNLKTFVFKPCSLSKSQYKSRVGTISTFKNSLTLSKKKKILLI